MKKLKWHLIAWTCWYTLNSVGLFKNIGQYDAIFWTEIAYNYISLVVVFYATVYFSAKYFHQVSYVKASSLKGFNKFIYLVKKWPVLGVLFVMVLYITSSVLLDDYYFGYKYRNLMSHIDQRFIREVSYIFTAVGYSFHRFYSNHLRQRLEVSSERNKNMQARILILKDYQRAIEEENNKLN